MRTERVPKEVTEAKNDSQKKMRGKSMDTRKLLGHAVTHNSWGLGTIIASDDKYVTVLYSEHGEKKYQFPKAFER